MRHTIAFMILAGSGLALAALPPDAPPPRLIVTYVAHSDPALPPLPSGFSYSVAYFAFSPDEQWMAVALLAYPPKITPNLGSTLLLLPLNPGEARRIQTDPSNRASALWSPDSKSVVVQAGFGRGTGPPKIYNLRGELVWTGPQSGPLAGFIAPGRLLALHEKADGKPAGFDTIDIRTAAVTPWRAPRRGKFAAIDSERGLLAMFADSEGSKTVIVDYASGKVIRSVKNQNQTALDPDSACQYGHWETDPQGLCWNTLLPPQVYFAENGKTLCEAALVGSFKNHPVCLDINTGKTIAEFRDLDGGAPASASTRGSRMLLTHLNYLPGRWGGRGGGHTGLGVEIDGGRVVWDFRSGSVVAAWTPSTQQTGWLGFGVVNATAPAVAISSLGHYVAEVRGDELHIYQVP
jgi:hypothetical protein